MSYHHALIFYRTITQVHVGCGQEVGVVDLPVIRERSTGYPYFPGSGIRGSLRDEFENPPDEALVADRKTQSSQLFGPEDLANLSATQEPYAGCLAVHDARILLFPVRSDKAVFLWVTCPIVLNRFLRDITAFNLPFTPGVTGVESPGEKAFVGPDSYGTAETDVLHLEEFRFVPQQNAETLRTNLNTLIGNIGRAMGISELASQTVLIHDKAFYHFVNYATIITQHNRLTSAKTVEGGMLFSVESLPPETIFYGMIGATRQRKPDQEGETRFDNPVNTLTTLRNSLCPTVNNGVLRQSYVHFGGKESIGMGLTELTWLTPNAEVNNG